MKRKASSQEKNPLVWINITTTGSNPTKDIILEVECIITDENLTHISPYFKANVYSPLESILEINPSLKIPALLCSESPYSLKNIEDTLLRFIQDCVEKPWTLAGIKLNTIIPFLNLYLPQIVSQLNSRVINVDTLRELCWRWKPTLNRRVPSRKSNATLPEVIEELRWYHDHLFSREIRSI